MPLGHLTIAADPATADLQAVLVETFGLTAATDGPDILLSAGTPERSAAHVIVTGALTDELDEWDRELPAQTVAGALWLPAQTNASAAAQAWLLLRLRTPATPLSDLTDSNERALRWSVVAATTVTATAAPAARTDPDEIKSWVDAQPQVQELGAAVERLGGDTGEAVLASVQRFRAALEAVGAEGPGPEFDAAVAEHLRQTQRSGFGRWRGAKARAASAASLQSAARDVAGQRVRQLLQTREVEVRAQADAESDSQRRTTVREEVTAALDTLQLPVQPDFAQVPRSWAAEAPQARRYVFVAEDEAAAFAEVPATVRGCPEIEPGTALCALVQSGFSLPAVR